MGDVMNVHPLPEIVKQGLAPSTDWLARRLNRGEINGYKVGRSWLMSDDDIAEMLEARRNPNRGGGLTRGTQKRRTA